MSKKEKPLPKQPSTPFRKKRSFEQADNKETLMADRMAMAMSEGKLDEFVKNELPDNEHARKLAEMMMGMTGMMHTGFSAQSAPEKRPEKRPEPTQQAGEPAAPSPPDEVVEAVKGADVNGLMELLKKEHQKRQGGAAGPVKKEKKAAASAQPQAAVEKEIIEQMLKIAHDNNLTLDWIFFRALKKYVQEYQTSGNL